MEITDSRGRRLHLSRDDLREHWRQTAKPEVLNQAGRPLGKLGIEAAPQDRRVDVHAERSHRKKLPRLPFLRA